MERGRPAALLAKARQGPLGIQLSNGTVPCSNAYFTTGRLICKVEVVVVKYDYKKCEL